MQTSIPNPQVQSHSYKPEDQHRGSSGVRAASRRWNRSPELPRVRAAASASRPSSKITGDRCAVGTTNGHNRPLAGFFWRTSTGAARPVRCAVNALWVIGRTRSQPQDSLITPPPASEIPQRLMCAHAPGRAPRSDRAHSAAQAGRVESARPPPPRPEDQLPTASRTSRRSEPGIAQHHLALGQHRNGLRRLSAR